MLPREIVFQTLRILKPVLWIINEKRDLRRRSLGMGGGVVETRGAYLLPPQGNAGVLYLPPVVNTPLLRTGILDRLAHNAHRIEMRGDSMRKSRGKPER